MNIKRWIAAAIVTTTVAFLYSPQSALAQSRVAIVDVGKVFKSHPRFTQQLESLKQQADAFKASTVELQQGLMKKAEVLRQLNPGSTEYNQEESKLAQEGARLEVEQKNKMQALMQAEAQLHYQTYQQVQSVIDQYCAQQGILLVLRFNSEPMEPGNPASVMQRVNGSVVYNNPANDITPVIIQQIGGVANTASGSAPLRR